MNFWESIIELVKTVLDFIVGLTGSLAWPLVVGVFLWFIKDEIREIIRRISKIEGKGIKVDLSMQAIQVSKEIEQDRNLLDLAPEDLNYSNYQDLVYSLSVYASIIAQQKAEHKDTRKSAKKIALRGEEKLKKEGFDSKDLRLLIELNSPLHVKDDKE